METLFKDLMRIVFIVLCFALAATLAAWVFHVLVTLVFVLPGWVAHDGAWAGWVRVSAGTVLGFVICALVVAIRE